MMMAYVVSLSNILRHNEVGRSCEGGLSILFVMQGRTNHLGFTFLKTYCM